MFFCRINQILPWMRFVWCNILWSKNAVLDNNALHGASVSRWSRWMQWTPCWTRRCITGTDSSSWLGTPLSPPSTWQVLYLEQRCIINVGNEKPSEEPNEVFCCVSVQETELQRSRCLSSWHHWRHRAMEAACCVSVCRYVALALDSGSH